VIPRKKINNKKNGRLIFLKAEHQHYQNQRTFGLIIGPTGTGKTTLVTKLCNMLPEGMLS